MPPKTPEAVAISMHQPIERGINNIREHAMACSKSYSDLTAENEVLITEATDFITRLGAPSTSNQSSFWTEQ